MRSDYEAIKDEFDEETINQALEQANRLLEEQGEPGVDQGSNTPAQPSVQENGGADKAKGNKHKLTWLSEVEEELPRYLVKPYIRMGKINIIMGDPGVGKTVLACGIAAAVTIGKGILDNKCEIEPSNVLLISVEDDSGTLRGRVRESGGDISRCAIPPEPHELTFDSKVIEQLIKENGIRLVVFDPLQAFLGHRVDMNRANEIRPIMARLAAMAGRNDCAVIIISHLNKALPGIKAIYRTLGSIDIPGAARSILYAAFNPGNDGQVLVFHIKSNTAKKGKTLSFHIEGDHGGVRWDGYSSMSEDDLDKKRIAVEHKDNPIVAVLTRLYQENPRGVFVTYEQLSAYAVRILNYMPCQSREWRTEIGHIEKDLLKNDRICVAFKRAYTVQHTELGAVVQATGKQDRGVSLYPHTLPSGFQQQLDAEQDSC